MPGRTKKASSAAVTEVSKKFGMKIRKRREGPPRKCPPRSEQTVTQTMVPPSSNINSAPPPFPPKVYKVVLIFRKDNENDEAEAAKISIIANSWKVEDDSFQFFNCVASGFDKSEPIQSASKELSKPNAVPSSNITEEMFEDGMDDDDELFIPINVSKTLKTPKEDQDDFNGVLLSRPPTSLETNDNQSKKKSKLNEDDIPGRKSRQRKSSKPMKTKTFGKTGKRLAKLKQPILKLRRIDVTKGGPFLAKLQKSSKTSKLVMKAKKKYPRHPTNSGNSEVSKANRRYKCLTCSKSFFQKPHLQVHIRIHTGEKPYQCSVCSKRFTQQAHLTRHVRRIHEVGKDIRTPIVEEATLLIPVNVEHKSTKIPSDNSSGIRLKKKSQNSEISKKIQTQQNIKKGKPKANKTTIKESFNCPACFKGFLNNYNLSRHQKFYCHPAHN